MTFQKISICLQFRKKYFQGLRFFVRHPFSVKMQWHTGYRKGTWGVALSLIIQNSTWQFVAFPYIQAVRKAAKHQSRSAPLIPAESTRAFHSTNLFLFSRHHIPTNSVTPLSAYKPTHNPLETSAFFYPLRWPIYAFNSVVNTKLPAIVKIKCVIL